MSERARLSPPITGRHACLGGHAGTDPCTSGDPAPAALGDTRVMPEDDNIIRASCGTNGLHAAPRRKRCLPDPTTCASNDIEKATAVARDGDHYA